MSLHELTGASSQCDLHRCPIKEPHCHRRLQSSPLLMSLTELSENGSNHTLPPMKQSNFLRPGLGDCTIYSSSGSSVVNSPVRPRQTLSRDNSFQTSFSRDPQALPRGETSKNSYTQSPETLSLYCDSNVSSLDIATSQHGFRKYPDSPKPNLEEPVDGVFRSRAYQPSLVAGGHVDLMRALTPAPHGTFSLGRRRNSAPTILAADREIGLLESKNLTEKIQSLQSPSTSEVQRTKDWVGDQTETSGLTARLLNCPSPHDYGSSPVAVRDGIVEGCQIVFERIKNLVTENTNPLADHLVLDTPDEDDNSTPRACHSPCMVGDSTGVPIGTCATMFNMVDGAMEYAAAGTMNGTRGVTASVMASQSASILYSGDNGTHSVRARYHRALQDIYLSQVENLLFG